MFETDGIEQTPSSLERFLVKTRSLLASNTVFGDFCDDNVCACAVSTLILLPVTNMSPEMDSATQTSYETRTPLN